MDSLICLRIEGNNVQLGMYNSLAGGKGQDDIVSNSVSYIGIIAIHLVMEFGPLLLS